MSSPRRIPGLLGATVTVAAAAALAATGIAATPGASRARADAGPTLVSEVALPTGAVRRDYSDGSTLVGSPAARVVSFDVDAAGRTVGMEVAAPGAASPAEAAQLAVAYASSGRSVATDAAAAGLAPGARSLSRSARRAYDYGTANSVYDSGCARIDDAPLEWQGCFVRKGTSSSDASHFYLADSSQAAGHAHLGGYWLTSGRTHHRYGNAELIVKWAPGSDISGNECATVSIGITGWGTTLSDSFTRCPTIVHVEPGTQNFDSEWQGCKGSQNTPGTAAETFTKVPSSGDATLFYSIGAAYQTSSC
jgi:hypothetical protein